MEKGTLASLRRYLLTGIVVTAPVGFTAFVLYWVFDRLDAILGQLFTAIVGVRIPGVGLLALLLLLLGAGWVAQQALGGQLISLGRRWLSRFPLTRSIYSAAHQIVESLVIEKEKFFGGVVLAQYPRAGCWALGFLTGEAPREVKSVAADDMIAVFIPTAPNPTSGVLVFLERSQVKMLKMSVEDAFKLVLSGGVLIPDPLEDSII